MNQLPNFQASTDALIGLTSQAKQGFEQLAALNVQTIKTLIEEYQAGAQAAFAVKSPQELIKLQAAALQAAPQKLISYTNQVKEIVATATAGQRAATEAQVAEVQAKFLEAVNGALKNAPGSANTIALVKSAIAAANNAYEGVDKVTKQVASAVEANVTTFTANAAKATSQAVATIDA